MILTCKRPIQRGTEDVMIFLSKEARNEKVQSILFLMPCHATPYYSSLHRNLPMRFLDCSPRSGLGNLAEIIFLLFRLSLIECGLWFLFFDVLFNSEENGIPDESDRFMMDPVSFASEFARNWSIPSHVVLFDSEERLLRDFLISHSFREVNSKSLLILCSYYISCC